MKSNSALSERRWLLVRLDRIGDLVLTMPVDESLPGIKTWWITRGLGFVAANAQPVREARELNRKISVKAFFALLRETRARKFDTAVIFHAPWWVSALVWLAGIRDRAGVRSQWHSFLFLNRAIRQKRSRGEHSELEYAYQLLEAAFALQPNSLVRHTLRLAGAPNADLQRWGLAAKNYYVVHPGMGGSALNWPTTRYAELIRALEGPVVITGTSADEAYLAPLREALRGQTNVMWLDKKLSTLELLTVLQAARGVVAPSTGVVHLAASVGAPTVGIYSPIRVEHPRRWGPQGARVRSLVPHVQGDFFAPECMEKIEVREVLATLRELSQD